MNALLLIWEGRPGRGPRSHTLRDKEFCQGRALDSLRKSELPVPRGMQAVEKGTRWGCRAELTKGGSLNTGRGEGVARSRGVDEASSGPKSCMLCPGLAKHPPWSRCALPGASPLCGCGNSRSVGLSCAQGLCLDGFECSLLLSQFAECSSDPWDSRHPGSAAIHIIGR